MSRPIVCESKNVGTSLLQATGHHHGALCDTLVQGTEACPLCYTAACGIHHNICPFARHMRREVLGKTLGNTKNTRDHICHDGATMLQPSTVDVTWIPLLSSGTPPMRTASRSWTSWRRARVPAPHVCKLWDCGSPWSGRQAGGRVADAAALQCRSTCCSGVVAARAPRGDARRPEQ
jgi:hypothetical protein